VDIDLRRERFRPHVTLARFRRTMLAQDMDRLGMFLEMHGDLSIPAFPVRSFALYRSILREDGATYARLAEYPLLPCDTT
jgi:2'-5' RNA ligase